MCVCKDMYMEGRRMKHVQGLSAQGVTGHMPVYWGSALGLQLKTSR